MKAAFLFIFFVAIPFLSNAQTTYRVGAMTVNEITLKQAGTITISDSTYTYSAGGKTVTSKIINRTEQGLYITDGTAIDMITVIPMAGKIKGFAYTVAISQQRDKRFDGSKLLFFCVVAP